jgi:hypothetical protein
MQRFNVSRKNISPSTTLLAYFFKVIFFNKLIRLDNLFKNISTKILIYFSEYKED